MGAEPVVEEIHDLTAGTLPVLDAHLVPGAGQHAEVLAGGVVLRKLGGPGVFVDDGAFAAHEAVAADGFSLRRDILPIFLPENFRGNGFHGIGPGGVGEDGVFQHGNLARGRLVHREGHLVLRCGGSGGHHGHFSLRRYGRDDFQAFKNGVPGGLNGDAVPDDSLAFPGGRQGIHEGGFFGCLSLRTLGKSCLHGQGRKQQDEKNEE